VRKRSRECLDCGASLICLTNGVPKSTTICRYCHAASLYFDNYKTGNYDVSIGQVKCRHPSVVRYARTCSVCENELRNKTKRIIV